MVFLMTNFNDLSKKTAQFLSYSGYTVEEFSALLPHFRLKFEKHLETFTFEGKPRQNRKYVEYKNAGLPSMENKLLFLRVTSKEMSYKKV